MVGLKLIHIIKGAPHSSDPYFYQQVAAHDKKTHHKPIDTSSANIPDTSTITVKLKVLDPITSFHHSSKIN